MTPHPEPAPTIPPLPPPLNGATGWPWDRAGRPPAAAPGGGDWPVISLVMPSLNQGQFIEHALRSLLAQGYPRLEVVVMDGGSRDGTVAVLERYAPWLTHWASGPDDGPADALNRGFARTTGSILGFLNADDFLLEDTLWTVAEAFASAPAVDVLSGHAYFANPEGAIGVPVYSDRWHPTRFRYGACLLIQQATFFRRRVFARTPGFRTELKTTWDMELWADLAASGATFDRIERFLAAFRLHAGSITGGEDFRQRRTADARTVRERLHGHPETFVHRLRSMAYRARRFATHPVRSLRQRVYFHSVLGRWSL